MKRNYLKLIFSLFATGCMFAPVFSNDNQSSEQVIAFITGSVSDKTGILKNLTITAETPSDVRQLPRRALEFVQNNAPVIGSGHGLTELAAAAVPFYGKIDTQQQTDLLWNVFKLCSSDTLRMSVLQQFSKSAVQNRSLFAPYIPELHALIAEYIASGRYTSNVCLETAGLLGLVADAQSFDPLFRLITANYAPALTQKAVQAIQYVIPEAHSAIIKTLRSDSVSAAEKLQLFTLLEKNTENSDLFKAEMAENILASTIINGEDISAVTPDIAALQLAAVHEIARTGWPKAAASVSKYLFIADKELQAGLIKESDFLEVITCLEKMATTQTVSALTDYLGILNKAVASGSSYRAPIVLAVITALGTLGDKTSFDNLLYVTYLPYTDSIIAAARNALAGLKW